MAWFGALLTVVRLGAQDFGISTRQLELPEVGVVTNWVVQVHGERYCFMPPAGWRRDHAVSGGVGWVSERGVRLKLERAPDAWLPSVGTNAVKVAAAVEGDFLESRMVGRSSCYTEGGEGLMFDLEWDGVGGELMMSRVSVVGFSGVGFRFMLTGRRLDFGRAISTYQGVLTSFQPLGPGVNGG